MKTRVSILCKTGVSFALVCFLVSCGESEPNSVQGSFADTFQAQLIQASPGDVIDVPEGIHEFTRSLSLSVPNVTIRGVGMDKSILSFKNQVQGAEGLLVTADDFVMEDIAIEDTVGDALKINESTNVTLRRVRTEWTGGSQTSNGAYGIYPVQCTNVLIEESVAIGASDAGIYVGQSSQIIVRNSRAEYNVAGIEIENSTYADVYGNVATNNTGGILVFDLPNLEVQGGQATRVFNNRIFANNNPNFAPEGAIVGRVPAGTGLLILANDNIEAFENQFADNNNVNIMVYSYVLSGLTIDDPNYDPYPEGIYIHDNSFDGGGSIPGHPALLALHEASNKPTPDVVWDGIVKSGSSNEGLVCLGEGEVSFVNLNAGDPMVAASYDTAAYRCTEPKLPEIRLTGSP